MLSKVAQTAAVAVCGFSFGNKKAADPRTGGPRYQLYMPALVAIRHEPHLRAFYEHLLARGKTKMQALVAVMRKLLHAIFGMFKHNQTFDGSKVYSLLPATTPALATQEVA